MAFIETCKGDWADYRAMKKSAPVKKHKSDYDEGSYKKYILRRLLFSMEFGGEGLIYDMVEALPEDELEQVLIKIGNHVGFPAQQMLSQESWREELANKSASE